MANAMVLKDNALRLKNSFSASASDVEVVLMVKAARSMS